MEKHRQDPPKEETTEHTVTVIGQVRKIKLENSKRRASDLLNALKSKYKEELKTFPFNNTTSVTLNGRVIKMNDKGELEEDPILVKNSILTLTPQIAGGR